MKVHEIMTGHARSVSPQTTLVEAAGLMRELDVGALPVVDGEELAGILTDRDIVVRGIARGKDPQSVQVTEVMSGGIESVSADDDVETAVRIMEHYQIRRLPVLGRGRRLVGIISLGDIATSSNPAFSGMALRDVSKPNAPSARQLRLARDSEPMRMPVVPGALRGPSARGGRRPAAGRTRSVGTTRRATKAATGSSSKRGSTGGRRAAKGKSAKRGTSRKSRQPAQR